MYLVLLRKFQSEQLLVGRQYITVAVVMTVNKV